MKTYDVIVIGSGSGNLIADAAIDAGKRVALIERRYFGGTCLNFGCIPTKVLATLADRLVEQQEAAALGITAQKPEVDWLQVKNRLFEKIKECQDIEAEYREDPLTTVYRQSARFVRPKVIGLLSESGEVEAEITAPIIVVAAGGRSRVLQIDGLYPEEQLTAEQFFGEAFPEKPYEHLTIVGGGPIGCEFAHIFSALGTRVTLIQRNVRLLPKEDPEISEALRKALEARGVDIRLETVPERASHDEAGQLWLHVKPHAQAADTAKTEARGAGVTSAEATEGQRTEAFCTDAVLMALGIVPNTDHLDAQAGGLKLDDRGYVITDEGWQTAVEGVYAIGDINGGPAFRHRANQDAEGLIEHLFEGLAEASAPGEQKRQRRDDLVPAVTFTFPQVAHFGMTEPQAADWVKASGHHLLKGIHPYAATAKGYALGYTDETADQAFVKLLADGHTGQLLGVHAIGPEAAMMILPYQYLMTTAALSGHPVDRIEWADQVCIAHPSLAEVTGWATTCLEEVHGDD